MAYEVEVECLPLDLPQHILVDVSGLGLNEAITVGDIKLPEGVKYTPQLKQPSAAVKSIREEVEEEEVEEDLAEAEEGEAAHAHHGGEGTSAHEE